MHQLHQWLADWSSMYSNSAALKTGLMFAHVGGLLIGGGSAIATDRALLATAHDDLAERSRHLRQAEAIHRVVLIGLGLTIVSGLLLLAADLDTYLYAKVFWLKMAGVAGLLVNGVLILRGERAAEAGDSGAWASLRKTAIASLALWFVTTLLGAALPNV